ncbi:MAG: class I SAM-dependent methyltransferase [Dongiaceae bacterium]
MRHRSTYAASDGPAYQRFLGRWTAWLAPPFLAFARLPEKGPVLDVGCGTGSLSLALAARDPHRSVVGLDIAAPYIAFAQAQVRTERVRFTIGDACALPLGNGAFAGSLAQLALNFVPDAGKAVGEMRRVTRPGGVVAACVWDFRGGLVYQRLFWDTAAGIDDGAGAARDRLFSHELSVPDGLPRLWEKAGLRDVLRDSLTIRMDYAGFADYWQPLLGGQGPFGSYVSGLAPSLRDRIEAAVRRAYLSGAADGPRSMTATAWAVRGVVP